MSTVKVAPLYALLTTACMERVPRSASRVLALFTREHLLGRESFCCSFADLAQHIESSPRTARAGITTLLANGYITARACTCRPGVVRYRLRFERADPARLARAVLEEIAESAL